MEKSGVPPTFLTLTDSGGGMNGADKQPEKQILSTPSVNMVRSISSENVSRTGVFPRKAMHEYSTAQFSPALPSMLVHSFRFEPHRSLKTSAVGAESHYSSCSDLSSDRDSGDGMVGSLTTLVAPTIEITPSGSCVEEPQPAFDQTIRLARRGSLKPTASLDPNQQLQEYLSSRSRLRRPSLPATPVIDPRLIPIQDEVSISQLPAIRGLDAVLADPRQGIPQIHLEGLLKKTRLGHYVISIRPFARVATTMALNDGESKNLQYKMKTAVTGPHAGYPPLDQSLSKLFNASPERIRKFQAYANQNSSQAVQLRLTNGRIEELAGMTHLGSAVPLLENIRFCNDGTFYCTARMAVDVPHHFYRGLKNEDGTYSFEILTSAGYIHHKIFKVIADYDLGFIYNLMARTDLAVLDKPAVPDVNPNQIRSRIAVYESRLEGRRKSSPPAHLEADINRLKEGVESLDTFLKPMDKTLGNVTKRQKSILGDLNSAVGRTRRNPMFHHGPDNLNPVSDPASNYPLTVIVPYDVGVLTHRYYMVENDTELKNLILILAKNGYHVPVNPAWNIRKIFTDKFSSIKKLTHSEWVGPWVKSQKPES